ncbi:ubiquinone/menaquinone biosynthesis C-methylase UbiE [Pedobacter sp. UYP30]|uniref:class I SAM-dependent methyltransferase n=1 Tax=Pedobacter sp. UYP30 TaxID=1756400 RepID=UPI0033986E32
MENHKIDKIPGYELFASIGKKVLRPGGVELTRRLINGLNVNSLDAVVEFAPGLGKTAKLALTHAPASYIGVELDEQSVALLRKKLTGNNIKIISGNSAKTGLADSSVTKAYGEAMLTMQADHRKAEIILEAHRILKQGGLYGIHELALSPVTISDSAKAEIQRALAKVMNVNARPLTITEWNELLDANGFKVLKTEICPMKLLSPRRIIADEGFFRALKIALNIILSPKKRKRIRAIKKVFEKYGENLIAVAIISEKK